MSIRDEFFDMVRSEDNSIEAQKAAKLEEDKQKYAKYLADKVTSEKEPIDKATYATNVAKSVMCETFSRLYIDSIPIDEPDRYHDSLRESAISTMHDIVKDVHNMKELTALFENASPYMKNMCVMAEAIGELKAKNADTTDKEYPNKVMLDPEDIKTIKTFEKIQGKSIYSNALQDRVVSVYKAEAENAQKSQEKTQAIIDKLAEINNNKLDERSINNTLDASNNESATLFHSIFMNKSKTILNEAGTGADLEQFSTDILEETLCTYTLLECLHSHGIKTFDNNEREHLKTQFLIGKR